MEKTFLGILLLILMIVALVLRNAQAVQLDLWIWQVETSFSLVIMIALTVGALASFLFSIPGRMNRNKMIREKEEKIEFLENEIIHLGNKAETGRSGASKTDLKNADPGLHMKINPDESK